MIMRFLLVAVLMVWATCAAGIADAQTPLPELLQSHVRVIAAPDGRQMEITTGFVSVPEQRDGTGPARPINLAAVRLRWAGSADALVNMVLAGGPGDSGTMFLSGLPAQRAAALLDLMGGDVIGFDQRGSGRSLPSLALSEPAPLPLDVAGSPAIWLPLMERAARAAAQRLETSGVRLTSYTTVENADDVDAVRRAFGYARMNLWGRSYGSHLALATVRRHPDSVARLILVSPEGPDHTLKLPALTDTVIHRIAVRAGVPGLPETMRGVFDRLRQRPVTVQVVGSDGLPQQIMIGVFDLQWLTAQALGDPRTLATLPAAYREMAAGDFGRIGQLALAARTQWRIGSAMKYMMDLASYGSPARILRIQRQAPGALLGNAMNFPTMDLRHAWPTVDLGAGYHKSVRSTVPTLVLVGDLDARTPVENAREIARGLPNARLVVVENAAHQFDLFGDPLIQPVLRDFLRDQKISVDQVRLPNIRFQL